MNALIVLLALVAVAAALPQSAFPRSRYQGLYTADDDDASNSTQTDTVSAFDQDSDDSDSSDVPEPAEQSVEDDQADDTTEPPSDGSKLAVYGNDAAKERRRLANLRRRFHPNEETTTEGADVIDDTNGDASDAGEIAADDEAADADESSLSDAASAADETPESNQPAYRRRFGGAGSRFASTRPSESNVGDKTFTDSDDGTDDSDDETLANDDDSAVADESAVADDDESSPARPANERRRPGLRSRFQPASSDVNDDSIASQYDSVDQSGSTSSDAADSDSVSETQDDSVSDTRTVSLKDRLERYRQRHASQTTTEAALDDYDSEDDRIPSEALPHFRHETGRDDNFTSSDAEDGSK